MNKYNKYIKDHIEAYNAIDTKKILLIERVLISKIKKRNTIFTCGNGGAASISNHFLCDFNKGLKIHSKNTLKPKVISLSSNIEIITAISNDVSYNKIFSYQLENYFKKNDLLVTFSCSGNSKNIIDVIKYAKKRGIYTISFTGFASRFTSRLSDINLNLNCKNYGICEDIFQSLMHMISQKITTK
tara:strand:- start:5689 stop:6246 length:558 start_codon:yes stop_codon:yes gene_type:complete